MLRFDQNTRTVLLLVFTISIVSLCHHLTLFLRERDKTTTTADKPEVVVFKLFLRLLRLGT